MAKLNIAHCLDLTEVEGPGKRFAVWMQGCNRLCPGCCNPQFLDFVPKTIVDSEKLCADISASRRNHGIEGVTFLGGEPMLQARGLFEVAHFCRASGLSVMVFTGYILDELLAVQLPFVDQLLQNTDLLVDGAFEEQNRDTRRNWVGSANQCFHFLTDFYQSGIEYDERFSPGFELRLYSDGTMQTNGFPLESIMESMRLQNTELDQGDKT